MALIIDDRAKEAWEQTKAWAKEEGIHDKRDKPPDVYHQRTFEEMEWYLHGYSGGTGMRTRVTSKSFDLGRHGFNVLIEQKGNGGAWSAWMAAGMVYYDNGKGDRGWGLHS